MTNAQLTNAQSFRGAAQELRRMAEQPRYRKYAHAHRLTADSLDAQAAALEAAALDGGQDGA